MKINGHGIMAIMAMAVAMASYQWRKSAVTQYQPETASWQWRNNQ